MGFLEYRAAGLGTCAASYRTGFSSLTYLGSDEERPIRKLTGMLTTKCDKGCIRKKAGTKGRRKTFLLFFVFQFA